ADLDPIIAAALPIAAGTAWQALERGGVGRGHRVLVIGASGGVGTFSVQLAALRGAEVWALCGERNRGLVERLGAARSFDYREVQPGSPELGDARFDAVIDIAGTAPLRSLQALVRDGGSIVLVSGEGGRILGPVGRIVGASIRSIGSKRPLRPLAAVAKAEVLTELVELAASGALVPVIERTYPFGEARAALAHIDAGHAVGKVVVTAA
ncbi:MAG: zinc-binding dehydrogenase, partial [Microbacterium sp.]